jgi:hypothetical protein
MSEACSYVPVRNAVSTRNMQFIEQGSSQPPCCEATPKCIVTWENASSNLICFPIERPFEHDILQMNTRMQTSSTLKQQATGSSETLVPIYQTARHHIKSLVIG